MVNFSVTILALTLIAFAQPASKPNFTGEWKMNIEKSNFGPLPPPTSMTRSIVHDEPSITIVEQQVSEMLGEQKATRKYVTDGTPTTFESQGATIAGSASWNAEKLIVVSTLEAMGLTFNDTMTLSPDQKTMTSLVRITSPQGDLDMTVVFEKQ
jgi:hypothetical protein